MLPEKQLILAKAQTKSKNKIFLNTFPNPTITKFQIRNNNSILKKTRYLP